VSRTESGIQPAWKRAAWSALRFAKRHEPEIDGALYAVRRARVIAKLRFLAAWNGATVDIDIAPNVRFGRDLDITVWPGSHNVVRIGPGTTVADRTMIFLNGGTLLLGDGIEIRRGVIFYLWGGTLEIAGENVLSWGVVFHCADQIRVGRLTIIGEWSTIVDSTHVFTSPDAPVVHGTKTGPVEIGYNTWICAKATIGRNSKVGDHCIVAGNAVVSGEVPSGHVASGVGTPQIRPLALPWAPPPVAPPKAPRLRAPAKQKAPKSEAKAQPDAGSDAGLEPPARPLLKPLDGETPAD
jgi:acetyltransferase-like isoleucine patch superfamily enzyme